MIVHPDLQGGNMIEKWLASAFIALFCWGLWAFFPKLAVRNISAVSALFYESVGVMIVGAVSLAWAGRSLQSDPGGVVPAVFTGIFGGIGLYFYFSAARQGPIAVVSALTALYPVVTVILASMFLGEKLCWTQILGILLAVAAACLLSMTPEQS